MQITLSPLRGLPGRPETALSVAAEVLTVDGIAHDLSAIPEGGEGWPEGEHPFAGPITRAGGVLRCTVVVHLDDSAHPNQPADPAHWVLTVADGPVPLPVRRKEAHE